MDLFDAHPQGDVRTHSRIMIGALSPPHRLLAKIVLHILWPIAHRSELVLKRARLCMPCHEDTILSMQAHYVHHARDER